MKNDNKIKCNNSHELKSSYSSLRWFSKLKNIKNKNKRRDSMINYNLDGLGTIEYAILHREANRPLTKIKEFDKNTKFCPCCSLPVEQKGYIERFNFCDNTDKYSECGRGISLFFSYFRFSIFILLLAFISMALPTFYLTYDYTKQLHHTCEKIYELEKDKINETFSECVYFLNLDDMNDITIYNNDFMLSFNSINSKQYSSLHFKLINSYSNIDKTIINYSLIYFINLITLFIINLLYNIILYNINKQYDLLVTSPSDFTVIVSNVQLAFHIFWKKINQINKIINNNNISCSEGTSNINYLEQQNLENQLKEELGLEDYPQNKEININEAFQYFIKNKICESSNQYNYKINHINICYKINEYMKIEEKIQEKKKQILLANFDPKQQLKNEDLEYQERKYFYSPLKIFGINIFNCDTCKRSILLSDIQKEKENLEKELEELVKQTQNLTENNFAGIIFITFETMDEQEKFLKPYSMNYITNLLIKIKDLKYFLCSCFISKEEKKRFLLKRNLEVHVAPEPEDVIFENLQYSSWEKKLRILLTYFLSFIIIGICFLIILFLNNLQLKYMKTSTIIKYGLSLMITGVISIINVIFQIFLGYLTKMEKHLSMTNYYLSLSIKLTIFTFITTAIVPFISDYYINYDGDYDLLITNISTCFLTNSILTPIIWIFNVNYLMKKIKICYIEKKKKHNLTQRELNSLYELPDMDISYKYSYIVKTLLMTFFYIPIFPFGVLISFIGLLFGYFLEKLNFTKMYKRPEMINSKICEFYSNYFILNYFMLGIGDYIFMDDEMNNKWSLCNLLVFGLLIIIPYNHFLTFDFLGINESDLKQEKYDDIFFTFYNDYERTNPMTKKNGMKRFVNKLKEKKFIKDEEYEEILQNIENINLMEVYYDSQKNHIKDSIKRAYTRKKSTIINKNSNCVFNFNSFIKENQNYILNNLLCLGKQRNNGVNNPNIEIIEENATEKDNIDKNSINDYNPSDAFNDKSNKQNSQNLDSIINKHSFNNYKESEQKINAKNTDIYSPIKIRIKKKKFKSNNKYKNDTNNHKINVYNYVRDTSNWIKRKKIINKKKSLPNTEKNTNEYTFSHDSKNNINNKIEKYEKRITNKNNHKNIFNHDFNDNDIEIYNQYRRNKKYGNRNNFIFSSNYKNLIIEQRRKKYNLYNNIQLNNNKNDYEIEIDNNINNKDKLIKINNNGHNIPLFGMGNCDELHQNILNQYKK